jgi:hypothetical protein
MKRYLSLFGVFMLVTLVVSMFVLHVNNSSMAAAAAATAQCQFQLPYPDANCSPGDIFTDVTAAQVCTPGYSSGVRNVPQSEKNQVYAEYGITSHTSGQYEVDHFIPLELGGSNDISNLWPEPATPIPGFHEKDKVENYLHAQVCSGAMSLSDAQSAIASDWVAVYNSMP